MRGTILLLLALGFGGFVSAAIGAEYTVVGCSGQPASLSGWVGFQSAGHTSQVGPENCSGAGGAMPAVLRNDTAAGNAGWQVSAPTGTTIAGVTLYRKVAVAGTGYGYIARGVTPAAANYQVFENCLGGTDCKADAALASAATRFARTDVGRVQAFVVCSPTPTAPCQDAANNAPASLRITRADVTFADNAVPTVASGPSTPILSDGGAVSAVQSITTSSKDTGSGIASTGLEVDGQVLSEAPVPNSTCRPPYRVLVPCPLTVSSTLQFNPASVPDGPHTIRVFARDATGANVGFSQPFTVTTSARGAINGVNGSDLARVTLGVRRAAAAGHKAPPTHSTVTIRLNGRTVASGQLVNSAGQPITGARLTLAVAVDRGAPQYADLPANVITDSTGRFKVSLPRGPSWRIRVMYFARALDIAPAARADARVKVRAHATFNALRRHVRHGSRVVFRGHLVGSYRPAGIRVDLQGRRGRSYITLATAASRSDGTYRVSYRFTRRARGRFVFRLRVRHFPRFPYFEGTSRPVNVFVR
jgi:hypothetical protein